MPGVGNASRVCHQFKYLGTTFNAQPGLVALSSHRSSSRVSEWNVSCRAESKTSGRVTGHRPLEITAIDVCIEKLSGLYVRDEGIR